MPQRRQTHPGKYIRNGKVLANCQLQALEYYGYDAVFALMAVHVEAEAVGLVLDYRPGQYPFVSSRVLAEGVAAPYLYRRKYQAFTFSGGEFGFGGKGGGGAGEAFFKARRVYPFCFSEENEWSGVWKEVFTAVGSRGRNGNESVRVESGFLSTKSFTFPDILSIAFLPISEGNRTGAVLLIGHKTSAPFQKEILDIYLAVAGLVGTTARRINSEKELQKHRNNLEDL